MKHPKNEPSMEDIMHIAESPAGKKLISLLQSSGGDALTQAKQAAQAGDFTAAKANISQLMKSPQVQALIREMEKNNG